MLHARLIQRTNGAQRFGTVHTMGQEGLSVEGYPSASQISLNKFEQIRGRTTLARGDRQTSLDRRNDRQIELKTIPSYNFVCER